MFRITEDPSSGSLVQCLAINYKNDSIVFVDMDKVGVMAAYSNPLYVCVVHCMSYTVNYTQGSHHFFYITGSGCPHWQLLSSFIFSWRMQRRNFTLGSDLPDSLAIIPQSMDDNDRSVSYARGTEFNTHVSSAKELNFKYTLHDTLK